MTSYRRPTRAGRCRSQHIVLVLTAVLVLLSGCASTRMASLRSVPRNPLVDELKLTASGGPRPSDRTMQLLRVYNLADTWNGPPRELLHRLQTIHDREPSAEKLYALAEISYLGAKRSESYDADLARDLYNAAVLHAYAYLFDGKYAGGRNPYDPQFRGACDVYNQALEAALRIECRDNRLLPGRTATIQTASGPWDITCVLRGGVWRSEEFDHFDFVSNYQINGLKNQYQTYGLGVPLIAVRKGYSGEPDVARYYAPHLSFPVTAFLRPLPAELQGAATTKRYKAVLELYDPLSTADIVSDSVRVPLESDLTTPLAYFLSDPQLESLATAGLLRPEELLKVRPGQKRAPMGLYMVQPYEAGKIPVVMVHGLWSSPMTWMEMFNDLRSSPDIRDKYQFWFYLYPTAQPFWVSAAQMRNDLYAVRQAVDPHGREPSLDQTVLIGHSMGGLVSKLQVFNSGDDVWSTVSKVPITNVKADPDTLGKLQACFFFQPNPSVRRVVTIGTPHRGSRLSRQTTQWLLGKLIKLPQMLVLSQQQLFRENPEAFDSRSLLRIDTSIDSLAPDNPIFPVMLAGRRAPWVKYHNILGVVPPTGILGRLAGDGDGVVSVESARIDDVESELVVQADHTTVHSHPLAVLEVRRILLQHLAELQTFPYAAPTVAANRAENPESRRPQPDDAEVLAAFTVGVPKRTQSRKSAELESPPPAPLPGAQ